MRQRLQIERLVVGQLATNCYLLIEEKTRQVLMVDPGDDAEHIEDRLARLKAKPIMIVATHGHFDHILAARALQLAYEIPFLLHREDVFLLSRMAESAKHLLGINGVDPPPEVTQYVSDGDTLTLGELRISVMHLSGHTPGSIGLSCPEQGILLVGDTIFAKGGVGRTDFSYSDPKELQASLCRILNFPSATRLYPGHGETTTVSRELSFHVRMRI